MSQVEFIETQFKSILLKTISVELRGKTVAKGKLVFYEFKDFNY